MYYCNEKDEKQIGIFLNVSHFVTADSTVSLAPEAKNGIMEGLE